MRTARERFASRIIAAMRAVIADHSGKAGDRRFQHRGAGNHTTPGRAWQGPLGSRCMQRPSVELVQRGASHSLSIIPAALLRFAFLASWSASRCGGGLHRACGRLLSGCIRPEAATCRRRVATRVHKIQAPSAAATRFGPTQLRQCAPQCAEPHRSRARESPDDMTHPFTRQKLHEMIDATSRAIESCLGFDV